MEPKVSVIVPIYNCEKYLQRCIDSILNQSMHELEIILVDDGSTDSSPRICNQYREIDERIKVIHKKNARVSAARNDGIRMATAEYIAFVDSDDWIESNMYEAMYNKAEEMNVDFIMCDFIKRGKQKDYKVSQPIELGLYNRQKIEKSLFKCLIMFEEIELPPTISNWTCIFNRDFLKKNNLYYDEDIYYCEDSIFGSKAMYNANTFYYMKNQYFYNYFYNTNSTTTTYNEKKWDSYIKINDRLNEYFSEGNYDFSRQIKINMLYFTLNMLSEIGKSKMSFKDKYIKCKEVMRNDKVQSIFNNFKIPNVTKGLKLVINFIKYKCSFIYAAIFYQ